MEKDGRGMVHAPPGEGWSLRVVDDTHTLKATTENTGGEMFALEASVPPQVGLPQQVRRRTDEAFYAVEGKLEVLDGERALVAGGSLGKLSEVLQ